VDASRPQDGTIAASDAMRHGVRPNEGHESHGARDVREVHRQVQSDQREDSMRDKARCDTHHESKALPALCATCQRINVERKIVLRTIDTLLKAGYYLRTDEHDDPRPAQPTNDRAAIVHEIMEVDDEFLAVFESSTDDLPFAWVRFVYGNDGYDVICDYTTNLDPVLVPVLAFAEAFES
jgi:hypothetical protein